LNQGQTTVSVFWRVTLPFLAGYFVSYIYRSINAIIGPDLVREFGLSASQLGLLSGIYFFAFAVFQLPLGLMLDRYGPRRVNGTLLLVAAAAALWFTVARSATELTLVRALIGLGVSAGLMAPVAAFALWYPAGRLATMNGVAFAAGMLGAIAVTVPLELALRLTGWREVFQAVAVLNLIVALALFFIVPEKASSGRQPPLAQQLREFAALARDPAYWRVALCMCASQAAAVSLGTLWVAPWLRDVASYSQPEVARALLLFGVLMLFAYLAIGAAADRLVRAGSDTLPLLAGGVAIASFSLALLALGMVPGTLVLWCVFFAGSTSVVLAYSTLTRRYPREMAGRVNTALNVFVFSGMFGGQWAVGAVLNCWPPTATGYAPEGYAWALGLLWLIQFLGLAWLWQGRALLRPAPATSD
jgi:predicted MFS family arabinose efflux permease